MPQIFDGVPEEEGKLQPLQPPGPTKVPAC